MSAVREVIQFETHIHGQVHANAWTNMDAAQPSQTRPSTENDLPFVLVALEDVRVKSGVMHGEVMQSAHDLVEGARIQGFASHGRHAFKTMVGYPHILVPVNLEKIPPLRINNEPACPEGVIVFKV